MSRAYKKVDVTEKDREEHCKSQGCPRCFFNGPNECMIETWKYRVVGDAPKGAIKQFRIRT